jgi:O-acetylhomoserine/O-acetylserine sulfhydrylase-like pyridoxal-dependent enzyme
MIEREGASRPAPILTRPFDHGAAIVVYSSTK